jgi:hypothetical protein
MSSRPFGYVSTFPSRASRGPGAGWLVSLFLVAAFSTIVVAGVLLTHRAEGAARKKETARLELRTLQPVAEKYVAEHPDVCPTVDQLVEAKELSAHGMVLDPWQTHYGIECRQTESHGQHVSTKSAGPDRTFGTWDDVHPE